MTKVAHQPGKRLGAKWDVIRKVWRMTPQAAEQLRPLIEQRATAEGRKP